MAGKITTIRFNEEELTILKSMGEYLGLNSTSAVIKSCLPWAKQRIDLFLLEFKGVIQPLKTSEIDSLITTMHIIAKHELKARRSINGPIGNTKSPLE